MRLPVHITLILSAVLFSINSHSQEILTTFRVPPSWESLALIRNVNAPASPATGKTEIDIPLHTISTRDIQVPVSLEYIGGGIRVQDMAGTTGLGWRLAAGGRITRVVKGLPDELRLQSEDKNQAIAIGWWWNTTNHLRFSFTELDCDYDHFYFEFCGRKGEFELFGKIGTTSLHPWQPLQIDYINWDYFRIIDENGVQYFFGQHFKDITYASIGGQSTTQNSYVSTWYLEKIVSPGGDSVHFEYYTGNHSHTIYNHTYLYAVRYDDSLNEVISQNQDIHIEIPHYCGNIKSIRWSSGKLAFIYSQAYPERTEQKLDEIKIYGIEDEYLHSLVFRYGSFNCPTVEKRLKLQQLNIQSRTGSLVLNRFLYKEEIPLPPRETMDFDHWGYYNRAGNTHLRPEFTVDNVFFAGSSREVNASAASVGTIERIYNQYGGFNEYVWEPNETNEGIAGGLRIAALRSCPDENTAYSTRFTYNIDQGNTSSGTAFFNKHTYGYKYIRDHVYILASTRYLMETLGLNGPPVNYEWSTIHHPNGSFITSKYTLPLDQGASIRELLPDSQAPGVKNDVFFPRVSGQWGSGYLLQESSYDATGKRVAFKEYTYKISSEIDPYFGANPLFVKNIGNSTHYFVGCYFRGNRSFLLNRATYYEREVPVCTCTFVYDPEQRLPIQESKYLKNGDVYVTTIRYPFQYNTNGVSESRKALYALKMMTERHILKPVETVTTKNGKVISGNIYDYKQIPLASNGTGIVPAAVHKLNLTRPITDYIPYSDGTFLKDSRYKAVELYDRYDEFGNLIQSHDGYDNYTTYVYGYNNSHRIATVENAGAPPDAEGKTLNTVFYTGFEDDGVYLPTPKTGRKAIRGPVEFNFEHFQAGLYVMTWWGSTDGGKTWKPNRKEFRLGPGPNPGSSSLIETWDPLEIDYTKGRTYNPYYIEKPGSDVPDPNGYVYRIKIGTAAHYIDEVSIIPKSAMMTTNSIIPGMGVISESDNNGATTYYEYDSFGRLIEKRDSKRDLKESYQYTFKTQ